jgi:hypothetical protein
MQLTRLVYASHHGGTSEEALRDIFDRSCKNNANDGITGLLIAGDEDFLQLLEGGRTAVAECMMRIMKDDRHQRIRILLAGESESRLFSQWSMCCLRAAEIPLEIQDRYWVNGVFDPVQLPQAKIEGLCLALSEDNSDKTPEMTG